MPAGALIQGTDGNFYGVTGNGGVYGTGTVFRMTPQGAVTILHSFAYNKTTPSDGGIPAAGLVQASDGNFYGSTFYGGSISAGSLFRISSTGSYTLLHNFADGSVTNDGAQPAAPLIQATDGNLYGTTSTSGAEGWGTLYQLTLQGGYSVVRSFGDGSYSTDILEPAGGLVEGTDHNFYATAYKSTDWANEVAFKMTLQGAPTILHRFGDGTVANDGASSGALPTAGLIQGTDGNFYGTTTWGGAFNNGVAYKMTSTGSITILHAFISTRRTATSRARRRSKASTAISMARLPTAVPPPTASTAASSTSSS